ncbi:hypothetical protein [Burkholderia ubonensis]|uniref:hypothetical protein n=1 Tax=Burkholderia ubonensis TaxID=101571 RepID=UPI002ABE5B5A|nr:hypothetical protein [Burkholderia ubonensis]
MDGTNGAAQFPYRCVTGFDSSCVEARRLLQEKHTPPEAAGGAETGAPALKGAVSARSVSPSGKNFNRL